MEAPIDNFSTYIDCYDKTLLIVGFCIFLSILILRFWSFDHIGQ